MSEKAVECIKHTRIVVFGMTSTRIHLELPTGGKFTVLWEFSMQKRKNELKPANSEAVKLCELMLTY